MRELKNAKNNRFPIGRKGDTLLLLHSSQKSYSHIAIASQFQIYDYIMVPLPQETSIYVIARLDWIESKT